MHDGIVVADTTGTGQFIDLPKVGLALGEDIECQRFVTIVDEGDCFFQIVHCDDGEQRAKYLLLEEWR